VALSSAPRFKANEVLALVLSTFIPSRVTFTAIVTVFA
jgi:hypothetical protein